jgi:hypothetical protein
MKTKIIFLATAFLSFTIANARIWRVNNDPTKGADFTSIQAANDSPSVFNGDTLHIEPSTITYAGATINKRIFIIGNGYFLEGAGSNPGLQFNTNTSRIAFLIYNQGSAATPNSGSAQGQLMGCVLLDNNSIRLNNVANITITRCLIKDITFNGYNQAVNGNKITKCFITGAVNTLAFTGTPIVDVTFENNIFSSVAGAANSVNFNLPTTMKGLFRNNTFNDTSTLSLNNFYISNNIFTSGALNASNLNNLYKNNIFVAATPGNGIVNGTSGNVTGVSIANIFTINPTLNANVGDSRFNLLFTGANPNPAVNGGETIGGVITPECGAIGSTDPYRLSGIPARPTIYSLTVPSAIGTGATSMQISVSTKNNN